MIVKCGANQNFGSYVACQTYQLTGPASFSSLKSLALFSTDLKNQFHLPHILPTIQVNDLKFKTQYYTKFIFVKISGVHSFDHPLKLSDILKQRFFILDQKNVLDLCPIKNSISTASLGSGRMWSF